MKFIPGCFFFNIFPPYTVTNFSRLSFLLIALLIALCYSDTLLYPWHLDDYANIPQNPAVQLTNLNWQSISQVLSAGPFTGHFSRPVSYFTLAINYYFGQSSTIGYHIVNITIHILTSYILFHTIQLLFQTTILKGKYKEKAICLIAFLTTILWAIHPIQIQAVTYIVQRMTSLAALFSIFSIFWFLKSFSVESTPKRFFYITCCLVCYCIATLSKENAVLLPFSLFFLYLVFLRNDKRQFSSYVFTLLTTASILIIIFGIYFLYSHEFLKSLFSFSQYGNRPFSLYERLLTEPRIIVFYISLLFYPLPTRFSIDHSFALSTSLLNPWTTFTSLLLIIALIILGLALIKQKPLLSFPILFFLINHIIESSIIPLELIFEHRNYLPSLFLFLPLAVFIAHCITKYHQHNTVLYRFTLFATTSLIILLCWSTYARNTKWSSEELLWSDAARKASLNARSFSYLGRIYGWNKPKTPENLAKAVAYYEKALGKMAPLQNIDGLLTGNIGGIYLNYGIYDKSYTYYTNAVKLDPNRSDLRFGLAQAAVLNKNFPEALIHINYTLEKGVDERKISRFCNLRGLILLWQGEYKLAQDAFKEAISNSKNKNKKLYFYNFGISLSHTGDYDQAKKFLQAALKDTPQDILIMLSIIENEIRFSHYEKADKYAQNLFSVFDAEKVVLKAIQDPGIEKYRSAPIDYYAIKPTIIRASQQVSSQTP